MDPNVLSEQFIIHLIDATNMQQVDLNAHLEN